MPITIENETHWKSSDIRRIVRAAMAASDSDPSEDYLIQVHWQTLNASRSGVSVESLRDCTRIRLWLPKRGPKSPHSNAMLALAAAAIDANTTMLAISESYSIAHVLAYELYNYDGSGVTAADDERWTALYEARLLDTPPEWGDANKLIITKYKDPKKDGTYLEFVERRKREISRAEHDIERETGIMEKAKRRLKLAQARKTRAEKALKSAAERRYRRRDRLTIGLYGSHRGI